MRSRAVWASVLVVLAGVACAGKGSSVRAQIHPGMSTGEVLQAASGWLFCGGYPEPRPNPEAFVRVTSDSLEIRGFGNGDGTFRYASQEELALALAKFMQAHPGNWTFMFGYVAVPKREYFDVSFDAKALVSAVSAIRYGGP
jgi:hypothetical protein